MQQQAMKSLILVLSVALAVSAEAAVNPTAEHLRTLATLLQEHHHRFPRQVATPPFTETAAPTTTPPTPRDGSEVSPTTAPSTGFSTNFNQSACQNAYHSIIQSCFIALGLSVEYVAGGVIINDDISSLDGLGEIFCTAGQCQSDAFKYYEACFEPGDQLSVVKQSFRAACSVNNNGTFCYDVVFRQYAVNITAITSSCFSGMCTQECLEVLTDMSKLGCCVNENFKVLDLTYTAPNNTTRIPFQGLWDMCGLQDPGYCRQNNTTETPPTSTPSTATTSTIVDPDTSEAPSTSTHITVPTHTEEQSTSTSFGTPTPFTPLKIPSKSKCAKRARALSADLACSGGANIAELLTNLSAAMDGPRVSRLHSYLCSSQRCFNKYVKTYRACLLALAGPERNYSVRESVDRTVYQTFVPYMRKAYCARKDGQLCVTRFPEIPLENAYGRELYPCVTSNTQCSEECCNAVRNATEKYGCCFVSHMCSEISLGGSLYHAPCLRAQLWKRCGVPNPGKCQVVLRDPLKKPKN